MDLSSSNCRHRLQTILRLPPHTKHPISREKSIPLPVPSLQSPPSMLAPRKTLWSTPAAVVSQATSLLAPLSSSDVVYDVGCGDGRILLSLASTFPFVPRIVGVEIDEARAAEAEANITEAKEGDRVTVLCSNALAVDYSDATAFFLYLVPRGLRIIKPYLTSSTSDTSLTRFLPKFLQKTQVVKVVTYMSPLPGVLAKKRVKVEVRCQAESPKTRPVPVEAKRRLMKAVSYEAASHVY